MDNINQIKQMDIFHQCSNRQLEKIKTLLVEKKFAKGEYLFFEQEPATNVFFLKKGHVKVFRTDENGKSQIVNFFIKNQMFPHVGITKEGVYPATAEALADVVVWTMKVDDFLQLCLEIPHLRIRLTEIMDENIRGLQERLVKTLDKDTPGRIFDTLWPLVIRIGEKVPGGFVLIPSLTHQEIADVVGVSRETVTRSLQTLKKEGRIQIKGHKMYMYPKQA
ncbi:MAG TPA: Crp/Fnr family transcriptional regulator [Massilibacterium sp.]|nr:Crp/Fnr family transcriptional regulator [Massilibacterium sp.]